jgi:sortase (surface protein transpeptidase)
LNQHVRFRQINGHVTDFAHLWNEGKAKEYCTHYKTIMNLKAKESAENEADNSSTTKQII